MACWCTWVAALLVAVFALLAVVKIYLKLTTSWCRSQTCLVGKTVIVTGANTGIGFETALDFAKRGARVILACRNKQKAEEACDKIVKATQNHDVVVKIIDLTSLASVRAFAKDIVSTEDRLDVLVNNAGAALLPNRITEDGLPLLMQINYFSNFLLTVLLFELLIKSAPSRIVNVSSFGAKFLKGFEVEKIQESSGYVSYSKLCTILFTVELAKRLRGTGVTAYSLHPGSIKSELGRNASFWTSLIIKFLLHPFLKTCEEGAQTTIYTAVAQGIEEFNGQHFDGCRKVAPYPNTTAPGLAEKLWDKTVEILLKPSEKALITSVVK